MTRRQLSHRLPKSSSSQSYEAHMADMSLISDDGLAEKLTKANGGVTGLRLCDRHQHRDDCQCTDNACGA